MSKELEAIFREAKKLTANNKKKKKKAAKKTLGESRTARINRVKHNLMKKQVEEKRRKIDVGSRERSFIRVIIEKNHCHTCDVISEHVQRCELWVKQGPENDPSYEMSSLLNTPGLYEFNFDLPLQVHEIDRYPGCCSNCIREHAAERAEGKFSPPTRKSRCT